MSPSASLPRVSQAVGSDARKIGAPGPARFADTDARVKSGMVLAMVQVAPPGVYIAMSGQVFDGLKVRKDRAVGRFVGV